MRLGYGAKEKGSHKPVHKDLTDAHRAHPLEINDANSRSALLQRIAFMYVST
jgi:hypothetical protein